MSEEDPQSKMQFLEEKLDNFKIFIEKHAQDKEQIAVYKNMGIFKLILLAKTFFVPYKDELDDMVGKILERTKMDGEHAPKVKQYLLCFIEIMESL